MASKLGLKLKSAGIAEILVSAGVRAALEEPAAKVLSRMKSGAPVDSGKLRDSLEIWDDTTDRAVKRVGSRSLPYAAKIEADTGFVSRSL